MGKRKRRKTPKPTRSTYSSSDALLIPPRDEEWSHRDIQSIRAVLLDTLRWPPELCQLVTDYRTRTRFQMHLPVELTCAEDDARLMECRTEDAYRLRALLGMQCQLTLPDESSPEGQRTYTAVVGDQTVWTMCRSGVDTLWGEVDRFMISCKDAEFVPTVTFRYRPLFYNGCLRLMFDTDVHSIQGDNDDADYKDHLRYTFADEFLGSIHISCLQDPVLLRSRSNRPKLIANIQKLLAWRSSRPGYLTWCPTVRFPGLFIYFTPPVTLETLVWKSVFSWTRDGESFSMCHNPRYYELGFNDLRSLNVGPFVSKAYDKQNRHVMTLSFPNQFDTIGQLTLVPLS